MGIHDGHRDRLKKRFAGHGLDSFDDHTVLELLLFYVLPRIDTNELAHRLIARFGGLDAVFEASIEELQKVDGIGENTAVFLRLIPQVSRRYHISKAARQAVLNSTELAGEYLIPRYLYERDEVLYVVCLDAKLSVLCCREMSRGAATSVDINIRKIVELALSQNASGVILSHNHTSGIALPSKEDRAATDEVQKALRLVDIKLIDHIIVAGDDFVSMSDSGML